MADKKSDRPEEEVTPPAPSAETPLALVERAAEKLSARRGHRNKTWNMMAAELRAFAERIRQYEQ